MKIEQTIIEALLTLINTYYNNDIRKYNRLMIYQEQDIIISIVFGSMYTDIVKEYWQNTEVIHAEILYRE